MECLDMFRPKTFRKPLVGGSPICTKPFASKTFGTSSGYPKVLRYTAEMLAVRQLILHPHQRNCRQSSLGGAGD